MSVMPTDEELDEELLREAGGAVSLTEAAEALGVDRQTLYDQIRRGEALGMMNTSGAILVPKLQLVSEGDRTTIVSGIERAVRPFLDNYGDGWSALQWLISYDPNLLTTPIEALRQGSRLDQVERAARAYTCADER